MYASILSARRGARACWLKVSPCEAHVAGIAILGYLDKMHRQPVQRALLRWMVITHAAHTIDRLCMHGLCSRHTAPARCLLIQPTPCKNTTRIIMAFPSLGITLLRRESIRSLPLGWISLGRIAFIYFYCAAKACVPLPLGGMFPPLLHFARIYLFLLRQSVSRPAKSIFRILSPRNPQLVGILIAKQIFT